MRYPIKLKEVAQVAAEYIAREMIAQGHRLSGKLVDSIEGKADPRALTGEVLWEHYGEIINRGVNRNRIPFSPGSGARRSKYIDALESYARRRGMRPGPGETHRNIAFKIARAQKEGGMPTFGSRRFSRTGRRTGGLEEGIERGKKAVAGKVEEFGEVFIQETFEAFLEAAFASNQFVIIN